jgi:Bacterial protein of unknown function (DUF885)
VPLTSPSFLDVNAIDVYCQMMVQYVTNLILLMSMVPGQATAYKVGERTIRDLRQMLLTERGQNFDVRKFHLVEML